MGEDVTPSSPALEKMTVDGVSILAGTISSYIPAQPGLCLLQLHLVSGTDDRWNIICFHLSGPTVPLTGTYP